MRELSLHNVATQGTGRSPARFFRCALPLTEIVSFHPSPIAARQAEADQVPLDGSHRHGQLLGDAGKAALVFW